jgi:hypothetical protein
MPDLTFLMNADPPGTTNQFYALARQYFTAAGSTVVDAPSKGQTLEGVFMKLKSLNTPQKTINIVSHAVGFGAIEGPITLADQAAGRIMTIADDLQDALANKSLAPPGPGIITDKTRIVLYGCDVGRSLNFLKLLSGLFGNPGELLAPRRLSVFKLDGSTVKYRQAQSWSLVRKARLISPASIGRRSGCARERICWHSLSSLRSVPFHKPKDWQAPWRQKRVKPVPFGGLFHVRARDRSSRARMICDCEPVHIC